LVIIANILTFYLPDAATDLYYCPPVASRLLVHQMENIAKI